MSNYLETIYFRDEFSPDSYPQKLCTEIAENYFLKICDSLKGKTILDIGSGKGNHLVGFNRHGMKASGIDKRPECIEALNEFEILPCDIENEPFPYQDNSFDFVYSKSVLEHVINTDNFLAEAYRVLKPGGAVLLMTPDWKSCWYCYWDDYTHVKAWTRKGLHDAMHIHGFKSVKTDYFLQLPFIWKYPWMKLFTNMIALFTPDSWKWKDKEEKHFRALIRFSKEEMLLTFARKE